MISASQQYKTFCPVLINNIKSYAMIDSGNLCCNVISSAFATKLGLSKNDLEPIKGFSQINTAKKQASLAVLGRPKRPLYISLGPSRTKIFFPCVVLENLSMEINISGPFLQKHKMDLHHSIGCLSHNNTRIPLWSHNDMQSDGNLIAHIRLNESQVMSHTMYVQVRQTIPAHTAQKVILHVPNVMNHKLEPGQMLYHLNQKFLDATHLLPPDRAILTVADNGTCNILIKNFTKRDIVLPAGITVGFAQPFTDDP